MIIYSGSKDDFMTEVEEDTIAYSIRDNILEKMHRRTGDAEFRSWVNSLESSPSRRSMSRPARSSSA